MATKCESAEWEKFAPRAKTVSLLVFKAFTMESYLQYQ